MIDLREYNLIFWRLEDGKKFIGRRVHGSHYVLRDPDEPSEGLSMHKSKLVKHFKPDKKNSTAHMRKGFFRY